MDDKTTQQLTRRLVSGCVWLIVVVFVAASGIIGACVARLILWILGIEL